MKRRLARRPPGPGHNRDKGRYNRSACTDVIHYALGDEGTTPTTANLGATTPCPLWAGWTGMLDGTSRPTNPEYEPDGIHQEGGTASPGCDEPDPVTSRLA